MRRSPPAGRSSRESARSAPDFVDRLIARDEAAFEELVRTHGPRMLAVASRYLSRPADAEDALQESFVNVVRSISGFQRASRLETWLHRIVVNCALMSLRRRRRKPETSLGDVPLDAEPAFPWRRHPTPSAHDLVAGEETRRAVLLEVSRLPEAQRCVLLLRDVDGLELGEIAELLEVGLSTVKIRLRRARRALLERKGSWAPEEAEGRRPQDRGSLLRRERGET